MNKSNTPAVNIRFHLYAIAVLDPQYWYYPRNTLADIFMLKLMMFISIPRLPTVLIFLNTQANHTSESCPAGGSKLGNRPSTNKIHINELSGV